MSILVIGGTGFLGQAICKNALARGLSVASLSRSGKPSTLTAWQKEVDYIKGDSLDPTTYDAAIDKAAAIIHTVGVLLDNKFQLQQGYEGSYEHMNRDTALAVARAVEDTGKKFVYISAARGHFLIPGYITTKREVETWLDEHQDSLPSSVLRPGFMYSNEDLPRKLLSFVNDGLSCQNKLWDTIGLSEIGRWTAPVRSLHVDLVAKAAVEVATNEDLTGQTLEIEDIERVAREAHEPTS